MKINFFAAALMVFSINSASAETILSQTDIKNLSVTVYNGGTGLIKDTRSAALMNGLNIVSFSGISAKIQPETALITGNGIKTQEQNFNFDLLSRNSLLQKFLGKEIKVISTNPATGNENTETAKILSVDNGLILKIGNRIETDYSGRLIFPNIPQNLREKPTLTLELLSANAGNQNLQLTYLTHGLSWHADYVAKLNKAENSIDLSGWVTLTNTSGADYENAEIQFVAGNVNRVAPAFTRANKLYAKAEAFDMEYKASSMHEETLMDYHLYSLGRRSTILSNQTKQLALLSAYSIPVKKEYVFNDIANIIYGNEIFEKTNANVLLNLENTKKSNMGMPLPAGTVRVYKADSKERVFFVGEDRVEHTAENEKIKLSLGKAFDITAEGKETQKVQTSKTAWNASYEITFKNGSDKDVNADYYQYFPYSWNITESSVQFKKESSSKAKWTVKIPAKGKTVLKYSARIKQN